MEFLNGTFLTEPLIVQTQLTSLTLRPKSGMSLTIRDIRDGLWPDCPVLYARDQTIVAWVLCSEKPRFLHNKDYHPNRREIQIFVHESKRRQDVGTMLIERARMLWGAFSTCPWDRQSLAFFQSFKRL